MEKLSFSEHAQARGLAKAREKEANKYIEQHRPNETIPGWTNKLREKVTGTSRTSTRTLNSLRTSPSAKDLHSKRARISRAAPVRTSRSAPQGMTTVPENSREESHSVDDTTDQRPSHQLSDRSVEKLAFSTSETNLLRRGPAELVQVVRKLRDENNQLRQAKIPSRSSSHQHNSKDRNADRHSNPYPPSNGERRTRQQEELARAYENLSRLEAELQKEKIRCADSERSRKEAWNAVASVTRTDPNLLDDEHFKEQVEKLRFQVRHWVGNQTWKVFSVETRSQRSFRDKYNFLSDTCPEFFYYVCSKRGMELLVEAHIWQYLVEEVFERCIWAASAEPNASGVGIQDGDSFAEWKARIEQGVSDDAVELRQAWRVASARLMGARKSPSIDVAIEMAIHDLAIDFDSHLKHLVKDGYDVVKLKLLFWEAVKLDASMQQQTPHYFFHPVWHSKWKMDYSPSIMEVYDDDGKQPIPEEHQQVQLVVKPSLRKFGNAVGKNYNQGMSIVDMEVTLK